MAAARSGPDAVTPSTRPPAVSIAVRALPGSGVKHGCSGGFGSVDSLDRFARGKFSRISARGHYHADGRPGFPFDPGARQCSLRGGEQERREIAFDPMHDRLCLGVTEADVEFEDLRSVRGHHETRVKEAGEARRLDGWKDDPIQYCAGSVAR